MVIRLALVVVASGCLSKPTLHHDGGETDAPSDGAPDAFVYPPCTPMPSTFTLRGVPVVANVDRRDGTSSDELIVWGVDTATMEAHVWMMAGGAAFDQSCFTRRFDFDTSTEILPLDVYVGDVTGDTNPDLVMYGRETTTTGPQHEVLLVPGEASGTLRANAELLKFPIDNGFEAWGGTAQAPEPVYLSASTATGSPAITELFLGGLANLQAAISVSSAPALGAPESAKTPADTFVAPGEYIQEVAPHAAGDPTQLLVITQSNIIRIQRTNVHSSGSSRYAILNSTSLGATAQRMARFARGLINGATIGVTQVGPSTYLLLQVTETGSGPTVTTPLTVTSIDTFDTADMALADVDASTGLDLVAITDASVGDPLLRIYTNLGLSNPVTYGFIRQKALPADYGILAVGDFDGLPATAPQILVFSRIPGNPALCFVHRPEGCIASCGAPSC